MARIKMPINFAMSVRPSACISAVPARQTPVKFDTGDLYENLLRNSKFV